MPRFKDDAIVLREYEWSETSQVVILLTREHGKVRGLAKGSKRLSPSSLQRYSGGIELLTAGHVVATTKRTAELANVTEWDQQDAYAHLRQDLGAQWLAMYAAELTASMLADLDAHPGVYEAMLGFLTELGRDEDAPPLHPSPRGRGSKAQAALLRYQWLLLADCGYKLELDRDIATGGELNGARAYSFEPVLGGLTAQPGDADLRVRAATVDLLRQVEAGEPVGDLEGEALRRANKLLCVYVRSILDRELNTMHVVMG